MEIAKQELIVHAREAASRVLSALSGACGPVPALPLGQPAAAPHSSAPRTLIADRQMSKRMALDARKREQFQRLKEQFMRDQEVGGLLLVTLMPPPNTISSALANFSDTLNFQRPKNLSE